MFLAFMTLSYIGFSPSTMTAICHSLLPVFLPLVDLKMFEFIGIIPDILSLVILFSPMDLHRSLCQQFSHLYLQNHIINLRYNIFTWISHGLSNLNRLKSEILIIFAPQLYHSFHPVGDTRKPGMSCDIFLFK